MADPHMASVMKMANVSRAIEFQDTSDTVFLMSSLILTLCVGGGWIRSLVTKKVMINRKKATQAKRPMVQTQPCCRFPCPKLSTNGRVRPWTTNWAMVTATKRMVVMLVRSLILLVITPPKEV